MVGVPTRREQVAYARRRGLSQRRSCTLLGVARSALGYRSVQAARDGPVLARMAALGAQYPRFGYRRIRVFLDRTSLFFARKEPAEVDVTITWRTDDGARRRRQIRHDLAAFRDIPYLEVPHDG